MLTLGNCVREGDINNTASQIECMTLQYGPTIIGSRCCCVPALVAKLNIRR